MGNLGTDIRNFKRRYREIFLKSSEELNNQIEKLKPKYNCANCTIKCGLKQELFEKFPENCVFSKWQKNVINFIDEDVLKNVYEKWIEILKYRMNFQCVGCATCCKLACSEFSYEELKQKAKNGDDFATQFISIFIPYKNEKEAIKIYPRYFKLLKETLGEEKFYFYKCPKLNAENRCSDYENRPRICMDFPDNPLSVLPISCGFHVWKKEIEPIALMLHSMLEIVDFYKNKIQL